MLGVILAGGKSERFGENKALALTEDGVSMLQKALELLKQCSLKPFVICNENQDYSFLNCTIQKDLIPEQGPLGGLYTAFSAFENETMLVITCDMPLLTREILKALLAAHRSTHAITLFTREAGGYQPFPGIYESRLRQEALTCIQKNKLSMQSFISSRKDVMILQNSFEPKSFKNINFKSEIDSK